MGDFNYPDIDWGTVYHNSASSNFVDLVLDDFLIQHVNEPTRDKNVLDLVFTSEEAMIENLEVKEHFSTSDHNIVCWNLISKNEMPLSNVMKYNYSKADYAKIIEHLNEIDRKLKFQDLDAEKMWNIFCDIVNEVILKFVPKWINKSRKFPVWMTKEAKKQRKNKVRMWKRYKEDKSYNNLMEYNLDFVGVCPPQKDN